MSAWVISYLRIRLLSLSFLWSSYKNTLLPMLSVFLITSNIELELKCEETFCDPF